MRVIITNKQITIFSNNANNQSITMYPFLVDKKLGVCNILIIRDNFFLYKKDIRTYILLAFFMPRSLPEITLLVVDENKQSNHPQHCLFRTITLFVFKCYSIFSKIAGVG